MRFPFSHLPQRIRISVPAICCFALLSATVSVIADETFLSKPPAEWTEVEALKVLNDSPWAHAVTTTIQDSQCSYENPAFPGLFPEDVAQRNDSRTPTPPAADVKPDGAEYLLRLVSVKPMQAATERLISLDQKWARYYQGYGLEPSNRPTNLAEGWYNPADELTIAVILKRPGAGGASFLDYAFKNRNAFPGGGFMHLWACAAIKTANGQVHAVTAGLRGDGNKDEVTAIVLSFPSLDHGKPLISHPGEKLEFRFVANQRVFETTFIVNPSDLIDGSERVLHIPATVDDPTPASAP